MTLNDTYQILTSMPDPFDMACDDCSVHEIEYWENASLDLLHELHNEYFESGEFSSTDFVQFLEYGVQEGFIRIAE